MISAYKSYLQLELHCISRSKTILSAFEVGLYIRDANSKFRNAVNICSEFYRTRIWDPALLKTNSISLQTFIKKRNEFNENLSVITLNDAFGKQNRSLLRYFFMSTKADMQNLVLRRD